MYRIVYRQKGNKRVKYGFTPKIKTPKNCKIIQFKKIPLCWEAFILCLTKADRTLERKVGF